MFRAIDTERVSTHASSPQYIKAISGGIHRQWTTTRLRVMQRVLCEAVLGAKSGQNTLYGGDGGRFEDYGVLRTVLAFQTLWFSSFNSQSTVSSSRPQCFDASGRTYPISQVQTGTHLPIKHQPILLDWGVAVPVFFCFFVFFPGFCPGNFSFLETMLDPHQAHGIRHLYLGAFWSVNCPSHEARFGQSPWRPAGAPYGLRSRYVQVK
jgi:hypothetical protein